MPDHKLQHPDYNLVEAIQKVPDDTKIEIFLGNLFTKLNKSSIDCDNISRVFKSNGIVDVRTLKSMSDVDFEHMKIPVGVKIPIGLICQIRMALNMGSIVKITDAQTISKLKTIMEQPSEGGTSITISASSQAVGRTGQGTVSSGASIDMAFGVETISQIVDSQATPSDSSSTNQVSSSSGSKLTSVENIFKD